MSIIVVIGGKVTGESVIYFGPFKTIREARDHLQAIPVDEQICIFRKLTAPGDLLSLPHTFTR